MEVGAAAVAGVTARTRAPSLATSARSRSTTHSRRGGTRVKASLGPSSTDREGVTWYTVEVGSFGAGTLPGTAPL
jgi:hypothetical protein